MANRGPDERGLCEGERHTRFPEDYEPARDANGRLLPGHTANPKGRPKGALNRSSKEAAKMVLQSLDKRGGVEYINKLDDKLFISLLRVLMPRFIEMTEKYDAGELNDEESKAAIENLIQGVKGGS